MPKKTDHPGGVNLNRQRLPGGKQGPLGPGGRYGSDKEIKRQDAEERQELRDARTDAQQIERLDNTLGKGVGAKKERAKLAK